MWELGHRELHSVTNKSGRLAPPGAARARMCALRRKLMRHNAKADQKQTNSLDPIHIQQALSQSTTLRSNDLDTRASNTAHNRKRQNQTQAAVVGTLLCCSSGLRALTCSVSLASELQTPAGLEQEKRRLYIPPSVSCTNQPNYAYLLSLNTDRLSVVATLRAKATQLHGISKNVASRLP